MDQARNSGAAAAGAVSRRQVLAGAAGAVGAAMLAKGCAALQAGGEPPAARGRLKQSIAQWCFQKTWDLEAMCGVARDLGCQSIELVDPKDWPTLKKHGLVCALTMSHGFDKGMNNPQHQDMCIAKIREAIDASSAAGFPNVLTFTGYREELSDDHGLRNCVQGYKKVVGYAEEKKVTLCLEMLNSRVSEEMKGHPGYQGDHVDYVMQIIEQVGSPRLKLLFDVYHVQVMDGDVIRRLRQCAAQIGHVHTAGNPGRGELDERQEINYRAVFEALAEVNYAGYVGHEFMPTRDPLAGLKQAVALCTV